MDRHPGPPTTIGVVGRRRGSAFRAARRAVAGIGGPTSTGMTNSVQVDDPALLQRVGEKGRRTRALRFGEPVRTSAASSGPGPRVG
jgi:hypothetical protein